MSISASYDSGTLAFYDNHAEKYSDSTVKLDFHELYEVFLKELPKGGHILDAGCGSGRDTKAFLDRGYLVTAIDASSELARLSSALTGQPCEVLRFQAMNFCEEFDGIWACASLLHVPKQEMPDVMRRFSRALKVGGVFYISLKEGEGERIAEDGRFFNYYTRDAFSKIVASCHDLHEIAFWRTEETRSRENVSPWLNFLLKKSNS